MMSSKNTKQLLECQAERLRYKIALEEITATQGKVCEEFTECIHAACNSSYSAWVIADMALKPEFYKKGDVELNE